MSDRLRLELGYRFFLRERNMLEIPNVKSLLVIVYHFRYEFVERTRP